MELRAAVVMIGVRRCNRSGAGCPPLGVAVDGARRHERGVARAADAPLSVHESITARARACGGLVAEGGGAAELLTACEAANQLAEALEAEIVGLGVRGAVLMCVGICCGPALQWRASFVCACAAGGELSGGEDSRCTAGPGRRA